MQRGEQGTRAGEELAAGRYQLHEALRDGELFESYRATDRRTQQRVRVLILRAELALQRAASERFLAAPKTLVALAHPNIAAILAVESDDTGIPFVVEEELAGESLALLLKRFGEGMPLGVAIHTVAPVAEAIAAAHERGLAHGALSRDRVVLATRTGGATPKVIGFLDVETAARGADMRRADVRALGALLYEALSGEVPGERAPALHDRAPHVPLELATLVDRCLARDPAARPDASALHVALAGVRDQQRASVRGERASREAIPKPERPAPQPTRSEQVTRPDRSSRAFELTQPALPDPAPAPQPALFVSEPETVAATRASAMVSSAAAPEPDGVVITLGGAARAFALTEDEKRAAQAALDAETEATAAAAASAAAERRSSAPAGTPSAPTKVALPPALRAKVAEDAKVGRLTQPQARAPVAVARNDERRRSRRLGALLFLLFALFLPFAIPLLCDRGHAQVALGAHTKFAVAGFTVLSVIALVHIWALQLAQPSLLLRPVTIAMRVVTAAVSVLGVGFFLPAGALGPAEVLADMLLPWASGGFFLFLMLYGLTDAVGRASDQAWLALGLALLSASASFGSYRAVSFALEVQRKRAHANAVAVGPGGADTVLGRLRELAGGTTKAQAMSGDAGVGPDIDQQRELGGSEREDLRGVEGLRASQKRRSEKLRGLGSELRKVAH